VGDGQRADFATEDGMGRLLVFVEKPVMKAVREQASLQYQLPWVAGRDGSFGTSVAGLASGGVAQAVSRRGMPGCSLSIGQSIGSYDVPRRYLCLSQQLQIALPQNRVLR